MSRTRCLRKVWALWLATLSLLVPWLCASVLAAQLLLNGGFEEGGAAPTHWQSYGGAGVALSRTSSQSRSGYSAALTSTSAPIKWIYQTVAVTGGNPYTLSGYALKNDAQVESVFLRIAWYASVDGTGQEISHADSTETLYSDSAQFRLLTTGDVAAPLVARSARVMGMLRPLSTAEATAYFDDFSLEGEVFTPTPTSTSTPTPTATSTPSPTPTFSPTPTLTATPTATEIPTPTPTATWTASPTATSAPSPTATPQVNPTPSPTPTIGDPTATATLVSTPTSSDASPTSTPSPTLTPTPSPTSTASPTPRPTPSPTATTSAGPLGLLGETRVLLSEVMVDPTQNQEAANEWVELYNPTAQALDLAGWVLADNISSKALPQTILGPGAYLVVAGKIDVFLASQPGFRGSVVASPGGRIGNGLSNQADMVVLRDPSGRLADSLNWGRPQASWPNYDSALWDPGLSPPPPGYVLARAMGQVSPLSPSAWTSSSRPSAGQANPAAQPSPTPSASPTRSPTPSPTPTLSATSTGTPTLVAKPAGAPATAAAPTSTPSGRPTIESGPSPGAAPSPSRTLSIPTRALSLDGTRPTGGPTPGQTPASQATATPALPLLSFSRPWGEAAPQKQDRTEPASAEGTPRDEPIPVQPVGGPQVLPLLLMAIPLLGLAFWLKDRLFP